MNNNLTATIAVMFVIFIGAFTMLGWMSLDTFTHLWQGAFVVAIKSAVFAMIPFGFLLGIVAWLD